MSLFENQLAVAISRAPKATIIFPRHYSSLQWLLELRTDFAALLSELFGSSGYNHRGDLSRDNVRECGQRR